LNYYLPAEKTGSSLSQNQPGRCRGGLPIEQIMNNRKQKSLREIEGIIIMDGLVSTGKRISQHNIKYNFYYPKNIYHKFYSHFKPDCG